MNVLHIYSHIYFHLSSWIILKIEFVTYIYAKKLFYFYIYACIHEPSLLLIVLFFLQVI